MLHVLFCRKIGGVYLKPTYRGVNKGLYVLLSRTQAGPGRTVKQEQEEISHKHVQTFSGCSVQLTPIIHLALFSFSCSEQRVVLRRVRPPRDPARPPHSRPRLQERCLTFSLLFCLFHVTGHFRASFAPSGMKFSCKLSNLY